MGERSFKRGADFFFSAKSGETENKEGVIEMPVDKLCEYDNHPFKLYEGERLNDMVRSIREMGILVPIIVRPLDSFGEQHQILSGHNRVNAARIAGLAVVPAVIKRDLSDEEAALIVTETNLVQRSFTDLCHSERAFALASHLDALKKQGKRTDLLNEIEMLSKPSDTNAFATYSPMGNKLSSEEIGDKYNLSKNSVLRYARLTKLNKELLSRVDSDEIPLRAGVSLSYLSHNHQQDVERIIDTNGFKVDMVKAEQLKENSSNLTADLIYKILSGGKVNKKREGPPPVSVKSKVLQKYFTNGENKKEIQKTIEKALEYYFDNNSDREDAYD